MLDTLRKRFVLLASGSGPLAALTGGYHVAFFVGALFAAVGALVGAVLFTAQAAPAHEDEQASGVLAADKAD